MGTPAQHDDFQRVSSPFEGRLVRLRAVEEHDLPKINEGIWDPEVSQHLSVAWPEPLAGTREWWERGRNSERDAGFVIETLAGEFVGGCGLHQISARNRSAILGIWLARPYWERGYGTDAVRTLCRFAFQEMNLQRVELGVLETNPRGVRAYEKVGFKEEGRLRRYLFVGGRYVDMIMMGLLAEDLIEE
jgi:RimJ/RimL family protein N-acetyltransferase